MNDKNNLPSDAHVIVLTPYKDLDSNELYHELAVTIRITKEITVNAMTQLLNLVNDMNIANGGAGYFIDSKNEEEIGIVTSEEPGNVIQMSIDNFDGEILEAATRTLEDIKRITAMAKGI